MGDAWTIPAKVLRVVDADTLSLRLSLGFYVYLERSVRLIGINAPEMSTEEGKAARGAAIGVLEGASGLPGGVGTAVVFVSHQLDKYGRPLGQVLVTTQQGATFDLGETLVADGHAVPMR